MSNEPNKLTAMFSKLGKTIMNMVGKNTKPKIQTGGNQAGVGDNAGERSKAIGAAAIREMKQMKLSNPVKSVGMKLFLMFFISILVFVLSVGMISYQISKSVIKNKVADANVQTITQAGQKMDFLFQTYEDISLQILLDKDLQDMLTQLGTIKSGTYEFIDLTRKVSDRLNVFLYTNKTFKNIHLYKPTGEIITMAGTGGTLTESSYENAEWFKETVANSGKTTWLETKLKGYSESTATFAISRLLKNTTTNTSSGIILIEINAEVLMNELTQLELGEGSQTLITNELNKNVAVLDLTQLEQDSNVKLSKEQLEMENANSFTSKDNQLVVFYKSKLSGWNLIGSMPVSALVKDAQIIFNMTLVIALVAAVIATIIGWFVARMIGRPLIHLRNLMQQGARGKLTVRANYKSQDEIGQLGDSFDIMMQQITALVIQTSQSAQHVLETASELTHSSKTTATAAREIAVATDEISNGAAGLATESEKGNELTYHIGEQMKQVIEANLEMGTAASDVQSSSEQGIQYMAELIGKTNLTEEMMRSMVEKVDKLKDSTSSIRKILDVLNNISKQTNILSLNATIEAARAGAAGKGFMVVADEIRKLADQSKQSIDVVGQITETIQTEIDGTVKVLSNATPIFQEQIQSVKEADLIFKQVTDHMGGFIKQLSSVSDSISTLEQSQVVLSDAMTNVSAVAEESLATSEEVASLSSEQLSISDRLVKLSDKLGQLSDSLKETLSKFEVE
jgi:methyl-accepting chemotaxis protein